MGEPSFDDFLDYVEGLVGRLAAAKAAYDQLLQEYQHHIGRVARLAHSMRGRHQPPGGPPGELYVVASKRCSRCRKEKDATLFPRRRASTDGLQSWCKACISETRKLARSQVGGAAP